MQVRRMKFCLTQPPLEHARNLFSRHHCAREYIRTDIFSTPVDSVDENAANLLEIQNYNYKELTYSNHNLPDFIK